MASFLKWINYFQNARPVGVEQGFVCLFNLLLNALRSLQACIFHFLCELFLRTEISIGICLCNKFSDCEQKAFLGLVRVTLKNRKLYNKPCSFFSSTQLKKTTK